METHSTFNPQFFVSNPWELQKQKHHILKSTVFFNEKITSRRTDYKIETKIKLMLSRAWPCFSINLTNRASGLSFGMFRISRHPSINHLETQLHLYIIKSAKCRQIYHTCILWETKNMATFWLLVKFGLFGAIVGPYRQNQRKSQKHNRHKNWN